LQLRRPGDNGVSLRSKVGHNN